MSEDNEWSPSSLPNSSDDESPGVDGTLDTEDHRDVGDPDHSRAPNPDDVGTSSDASQGEASKVGTGKKGKKPGIDQFLDNTKLLFSRGGEVFPIVWVGVVILVMIPVLTKIAAGYDPLAPFGFQTTISMLAIEFGFNAAAITLFAASLPLGRAYLFDADGGPQTIGDGMELMSEYATSALLVATIYYLCVLCGLMLCVFPGLLAAIYLTPGLYTGTVRDESVLRSFLKGPSQLNNHSGLFLIVYIGTVVSIFLMALGLGLAIKNAGGPEQMAQQAADPLFMTGASLGFIAFTGLLYVLYITMIGLFVTIDAYETGQEIQ